MKFNYKTKMITNICCSKLHQPELCSSPGRRTYRPLLALCDMTVQCSPVVIVERLFMLLH